MSYLFKYYSKQYDGFMKLFKLDKNDIIIETLGDISNTNILDIGGGTGTLADKLIKLGANVTIVDPEKRMTDLAKRKNENVNILNEYSNYMSLKNSVIDIVIMRDAFHHIMNKEETLRECKRVLKENGKILICEFDRENEISKLIALFERLCFEKIAMLSKLEMKRITSKFFEEGEIIESSSYEYIYLGVKK